MRILVLVEAETQIFPVQGCHATVKTFIGGDLQWNSGERKYTSMCDVFGIWEVEGKQQLQGQKNWMLSSIDKLEKIEGWMLLIGN